MSELKRAGPMRACAWKVVASAIFAASAAATSAPTCGERVHKIDFQMPKLDFTNRTATTFPPLEFVITEAEGLSASRSSEQMKIPYTEELAETHLTPNDFLAGYYGEERDRTDASTCLAYRFNSNKNSLVLDPPNSGNQVLEMDLPNGCILSECALQARVKVEEIFGELLEEATLSYRFKFSKDFDFAKGGKLPGFCGGPKCTTGCSVADGLKGWSARHMWQRCLKDVASEKKCSHKFMSYLYHKNKVELCGDEMALADKTGIYSPEADRWYTMTSYIKMNTAGPPDGADVHKADGKIKTWLDDKLVMDEDTVEWRNFNNITISYVYLSVFYGGADYSWAPKGDHTIRFDDFVVNKGLCTPSGAKSDYSKANPPFTKALRKTNRVFQVTKRATLVDTKTLSKRCDAKVTRRSCWADCLANDSCQSVVLYTSKVKKYGKKPVTCCELKDSIASHRLKKKDSSIVMYSVDKREMLIPPLGWDDEGVTGRPDTCPNKLWGAPPGFYKWPNTPGLCQTPRKSICSKRNGVNCCQGVLVCLYQNRRKATCERPGEYRPADADPCVRAKLGEECGDNGKCCVTGTDCQYMKRGKAMCTQLQEPINPYPIGPVTCSLQKDDKCGGSMRFEALLRGNCCVDGLVCEFRSSSFSKCVPA